MENTKAAAGNGCRRLRSINAAPCCFHADKLHILVRNEIIKQAHGVRAAAHARHYNIRQAAFFFKHLCFNFLADNALKSRTIPDTGVAP